LESIFIPSAVARVGINAFFGCTNLVIRAAAVIKPSEWDGQWNPDGLSVFWGETSEDS